VPPLPGAHATTRRRRPDVPPSFAFSTINIRAASMHTVHVVITPLRIWHAKCALMSLLNTVIPLPVFSWHALPFPRLWKFGPKCPSITLIVPRWVSSAYLSCLQYSAVCLCNIHLQELAANVRGARARGRLTKCDRTGPPGTRRRWRGNRGKGLNALREGGAVS
jgi:hypothetical protein